MKKNYILFTFLVLSFVSFAQNVTITKIIETDCGAPYVKSVELYVDGTVDFSTEVVLNYMQNGDPWSNIQIDVSSFGTISNKFIYIVRDIALMQAEFPGTTFDASNTIEEGSRSTNGDDGYQIVLNGAVVSQFGKTETDADDDTIWEHDDSVVSRKSGTVDTGAWDETHWDYSGKNSTDGSTACKGGDGVEAFLASLGGTYPLGSGSGWTEALSTDPMDDFEGNGNITWAADGDTGMDIAFANPSSTGINTSATVLEYSDTGQQYANINFDLSTDTSVKYDLSTKNVFTLKVFVPTPAVAVAQSKILWLKLQDVLLGKANRQFLLHMNMMFGKSLLLIFQHKVRLQISQE